MQKEPNDSGLSLVEVIVVTMLMGLGLATAASLFGTSSRGLAAADYRSQATQLATQELETIRTMPYKDIWLDSSFKEFEKEYVGDPTVTFPAGPRPLTPSRADSIRTRSPVAPVRSGIAPVSTRTINDTDYTIIRHITWEPVKTEIASDPHGYKVIVIDVQWTDSSGDHQVQQESGVFQGEET